MAASFNRNAPCTCGSGKKYKKCCGLKEAISINSLIEREIQQIQAKIIGDVDYMYGNEIDEDFDRYVLPALVDDEKEIEFFGFIHTVWFALFKLVDQNRTFLQDFIHHRDKTVTRASLRDIVASWHSPRPVAGRMLELTPTSVTMKDTLTDEHLQIKLLQPSEAEPNSFIFGFIVPYREEWIFFPTFFDLEGESDQRDEEFIKQEFAESKYDDPIEFLKNQLLYVMNEIQFLSAEVNIDNFNWPLPVHKVIAELLVQEFKSYGSPPELTGTGIALWNRYCQIKPKQVKSKSVYVAAVQYVAMEVHPLVDLTINEFALETNVSAASLGRIVRDLKTTLTPELRELRAMILEDLQIELEEDEYLK